MTRNSIGSAKRRWRDIELDRLAYFYYIGKPIKEISRSLDRPEKEVCQALETLGMLTDEDREEIGQQVRERKRDRTGQHWTVQEDTILEALAMQNVSIQDICYALDRDSHSVFRRMRRLRLFGEVDGYPVKTDSSQWSAKDTHLLREMYMTDADIPVLAEYFDRSENAIRARLFSMGLTRVSPLPPLRRK